MTTHLTILLDGITADDYLTWVRDPEPPALGRELRAVAAEPDPAWNRIDLELVWEDDAPNPPAAAGIAGFPLTAEVAAVVPLGAGTSPAR